MRWICRKITQLCCQNEQCRRGYQPQFTSEKARKVLMESIDSKQATEIMLEPAAYMKCSVLAILSANLVDFVSQCLKVMKLWRIGLLGPATVRRPPGPSWHPAWHPDLTTTLAKIEEWHCGKFKRMSVVAISVCSEECLVNPVTRPQHCPDPQMSIPELSSLARPGLRPSVPVVGCTDKANQLEAHVAC